MAILKLLLDGVNVCTIKNCLLQWFTVGREEQTSCLNCLKRSTAVASMIYPPDVLRLLHASSLSVGKHVSANSVHVEHIFYLS